MSRELIDHSPDLQQLSNEGYDIEIRANLLLVKQVPYVTAAQAVMRGILVSELTTSGNAATTPQDHTAYFVGELPCNNLGQPLDAIINPRGAHDLGGGLLASCRFSSKPTGGYPDYYAKMTSYVNILTSYAQAIEPGITAKLHRPLEMQEDESVFHYIDSASSRAHINAITEKLKLGKVAIVGLGGTGSYILDLIAKTPIEQIHLYDGDTLLTHNAFRAPGAASLEELKAAPKKVAYFKGKYDPLRRNIFAHPVDISEANIDELRDMAFVFLAMDSGPAKKLIIERLEEFDVPFVDTGIGVYRVGNALGGLVRTTASLPGHRELARKRISLDDTSGADDEYQHNVQIAELNTLNATLAVIEWKKLAGFYIDAGEEYSSAYAIDSNHLFNDREQEPAE